MVASQDIGNLGPRDSSPTSIAWRWYYHVPSLGLWGLLVLLLVVVKANRGVQAGLIALPVLAVALVWSLLARLLFLSAESAESFGGFLVALAGAWAAVWLLAPWLARRRLAVSLALALAAMLVAGGVYYFSVYGWEAADELTPWGVLHVAGVLTLLLATTLAAYHCRHGYQPRRFMAWLLLWMVLVPVFSIPLATLGSALFWADGLEEFVTIFVMALIGSLIGGGLLGLMFYLLNLPFLVLALRNPFFAARFQSVLRLTPAAAGPAGTASPAQTPALEAVMATMGQEP